MRVPQGAALLEKKKGEGLFACLLAMTTILHSLYEEATIVLRNLNELSVPMS